MSANNQEVPAPKRIQAEQPRRGCKRAIKKPHTEAIHSGTTKKRLSANNQEVPHRSDTQRNNQEEVVSEQSRSPTPKRYTAEQPRRGCQRTNQSRSLSRSVPRSVPRRSSSSPFGCQHQEDDMKLEKRGAECTLLVHEHHSER
ncbi:hypothetical protein [Paenibacillus endoradicis]|uniref:hypothetical protein n=1 Tax=Paenibacillus endoradicis TaxID=2972487 RepID=UPI002158B4DC|nr:hypothetical protein [Paenibacillus endoradicis]MCR8659593.1 hypothetical protein [Paenibacillus endoradicis]